ncbi:LGFP repeat-containing protein [Cellulomonas massiliensis]|uniref:LGFP repeat-containing protein n=1 Tax=Cellulomonas massiliensis TaxID=1465811 RepID=UPI00031470F7|nr:hypothetical protein [Cellulomonas massiliensis]
MSRLHRAALALGAALALVAATLVAAPAAQAATVSFAMVASQPEFRPGEGVVVSGRVQRGSSAWTSVPVQLVAVPARGDKFVAYSGRTNSSGRFAFPVNPRNTTRYYLRTMTSPRHTSDTVLVKWTDAAQSLTSRQAMVGSRLGAARGGVVTLSSADIRRTGDSGVSSARYRTYERGMLVEVVRSGARRTWFVNGQIATRYRSTGGPTGTFGLPRQDGQCLEVEQGCTQQFSKVNAYASATTSQASYQAGGGKRAQYLAVARSQVGYDEPSWRRSKYNAYFGYSSAWCGTFQSWVSDASGTEVLPTRSTFEGFVKAVKRDLVTYKPGSGRSPRVGTLVFFDFRNSRPTTASHVGVLISRSGSTLTLVEGNSSVGSTFTSDRGVYVHQRSASRVLFYADPDW